MLDLVTGSINFAQEYAGRIFLAASVICAAEYLLPQSKHSTVSRFRGVIFWAVYIVITALGLTLFNRLWAYLGISPLFYVDLSFLSSTVPILAPIGGILASLVVIQISELFYYWFHRLQHANPLLWRFHAEHHSLEEMNAFNSNHHFTEELLRIPFMTLPISLIFSFEQGYVPWLWAFLMGWQGIYEHSATKLHFGWFRYIVPDNRFHRIHHSREEKHLNRNFGSSSALWDIVFGTAYYPRNDEWPDTGLAELSEPKTLREFLFRPFRRRENDVRQSEQITMSPP
jgi:sterol desaturase/sphingolipid hydroxylase (fatty acid hydroxylase superfamily)